MRFLVVGGNGFIGSHIVDGLLKNGYKVRVFDRQRELFRDELPAVEYVYGDFEDSAALGDALKGVEIVIHLVSTTIPQTSNQNPSFDVQSNLVGTLGLLSACHLNNVKKIFFISSGGVIYGIPSIIPIPETHPTEPFCSYGITKLAIEKYLALYKYLHGIEYSVFRCSNPYGERQNPDGQQGAIAVFLSKAAKGEEITIWGDGQVVRDYFYISDLVDALINAFEKGSGGIFNIGSSKGISLNDLLKVIENITSKKMNIRFTPGRKLDVPVNVLDISLAFREFGWSPKVSIEQGIKHTWDWISGIR